MAKLSVSVMREVTVGNMDKVIGDYEEVTVKPDDYRKLLKSCAFDTGSEYITSYYELGFDVDRVTGKEGEVGKGLKKLSILPLTAAVLKYGVELEESLDRYQGKEYDDATCMSRKKTCVRQGCTGSSNIRLTLESSEMKFEVTSSQSKTQTLMCLSYNYILNIMKKHDNTKYIIPHCKRCCKTIAERLGLRQGTRQIKSCL